jgi:hypothetical protein
MLYRSFFAEAVGRNSRFTEATRPRGGLFRVAKPSSLYILVDPLVIDRPTLPYEQDMQPTVTVTDPGGRQLPETNPEGHLWIGCALVPVTRTRPVQDAPGPPLTELIHHP